MSRFDEYRQLDTTPNLNGDRGFIGVNMRLDPAQLPPGYVSKAINARFRNGVAESRKGIVVVPWLNKIVGSTVQPWASIHGVGVFGDPFSLQDYLIIAAEGSAFWCAVANRGVELDLPAGVTITGSVTFTQAFDVLIMHRGADEETLAMPRISIGFLGITQTPEEENDGTRPIPNAESSIYVQGRLFIPKIAEDEIAASDIGDYTRYVPVLNEFKVNPGSADDLVNIFKFNDTTFVAFKEHSIHVILDVYGDLSAAKRDELTSQFGLVAKKSIAHVGSDLWFLSELGVMTIGQTEQNKLQSVVLPVSDPIQPLIERINWTYAATAVAAYWDNKYYLAVPLDDAEALRDEILPLGATYRPFATYVAKVAAGGMYRWVKGASEVSLTNGTEVLTNSADFVAQGSSVTVTGTSTSVTITASLRRVFKGVNNAVLVYDFLNGAWGKWHDEGPGIEVVDFFVFPYRNVKRLFFYNPEGYVLLYEEDFEDQLTVPYTDVDARGVLPGATIQVNGGTIVPATEVEFNFFGDVWGVQSGLGAANLWTDGEGIGGYGRSDTWTAPNTTPMKIATGVRFYGTNGVIPAVVTTGSTFVVTEVNTVAIQFLLETRGYAAQSHDLQDFQYCYVDVQTWNPKYTINALTGGVNETTSVVANVEKSRAGYYEPADEAPFDLDNASGRFEQAYREDYSVELASAPGIYLGDGIILDHHQETRETERVHMKGRAARLRVANTQGRIRVMSALFEADLKELRAGSLA